VDHIFQVFAHAAKVLANNFQPHRNDRLGLPSRVSPHFKKRVLKRVNARIAQGTWPTVILPQSNHVGISWTPIFTFAKHNLTDRRVPDILIYVMTMLQLLRVKGIIVILETRA